MEKELFVYDLICEYEKEPIGIDKKRPRISWKIDSKSESVMQEAYQIQVSEDEKFNYIIWDTKKVKSDDSVNISFDGKELKSKTRYYYRVKIWDNKGNQSKWSETSFFETGMFDKTDWKADWIKANLKNENEDPTPFLRKVFKAKNKVKSARVYITAKGLYELYINNTRIGENYFTPGWTKYDERIQYQTYDVTKILNNGGNGLCVILGNGWYKGYLAWDNEKAFYGNDLELIFQMEIEYEDGMCETIISDESWKSSFGPIRMSEIYHGEIYDANLEMKGFSSYDFDDSNWDKTITIDGNYDKLVAHEGAYVRKIDQIDPIEIINTPKEETVIDFGQNMVGWVKFKVKGNKGDKVKLKHAEVLDKDGNFYTQNIRSAKQEIEYILSGEGEEVFEPHFTFQGFRYVKLAEYPGDVNVENFKGIVLHSDMENTLDFKCSNSDLNQLQHNILWGQKGNFLDVPTDCPQRDERLGWTGDAQVFARTAAYNMNVARFFDKWLSDLKAEQKENGAIPIVVPSATVGQFGEDSACGWGDAGVIIPWTVYLAYGDKGILEKQYNSMRAYVEYIKSRSEDGVLWNTGFHFGDWLALDSKEGSYHGLTSNDYTATAYYAYSSEILAKTAKILGKKEESKKYFKLNEDIKVAFKKEFVTPNGRLTEPTQTACVLALAFNLVDGKDKERTIETLVKYLKESKWHLTTGFLGTPYLCQVLSDNNRSDVAYKLLLKDDYPSWLYQIKKGATTIWEHWDGIKEDGSFWSADMNSFNHYAYGSIGEWMYKNITGIDTDEVNAGYKKSYIRPVPTTELDWAEAKLETLYGELRSGWKKEGNKIKMEIEIPNNTVSEITVPFIKSGLKINNEESDKYDAILEENQATIKLGSGVYSIVYECDEDLLVKPPKDPKKNPWEND